MKLSKLNKNDIKKLEKEILDNRDNNKREDTNIDIVKPSIKNRFSKFTSKFDNLKIKYKKDPKKYALLLSSLLLGFSLVIGSSYAYLTYISKTDNTTLIEAGTLALIFKNESNSITLDKALPMSDSEGLLLDKEYEFTIENTGSLPANYTITLDNTCVVGKSYTLGENTINADMCIPDKYIKVGLKEGNNDYKVLKYNKDDSSYILDAGSLNAKKDITYKMKIWLDYDTPNEYNPKGVLNVIYSGKLGLAYEQGIVTGPNEPILSENMIPVYYDEKTSVWRKADVNNHNSKTITYKLGDVDGSGSIQAVDYQNINNVVSGVSTKYDYEYIRNAGDVDGDGELTTNDSNVIKQYIMNEISVFPAGQPLEEKSYSTNAYKWYNYDEKMWANSVTVKDDVATINEVNKGSLNVMSITPNDIYNTFDIDESYEFSYTEPTFEDGKFVFQNKASLSTIFTDSGSSLMVNGFEPDILLYIVDKDSTDKYYVISGSLGGLFERTAGVNKIRTKYKEASEGTKIDMDDILTMQVWIPRYKYKVWNYNLDGTVTSDPQEIQITFEKGTNSTGDITCTDNVQGTSNGTSSGTQPTASEICKINNTECTDDTCNNKTYTHPAFTFGDKELKGIWVGKFENSSDATCTPADRSAINEGCNLTSIRPLVKPNVTSWRGAMVSVFENNMMAMNDSNNKYGFTSTDDTHMIKNMEWGAVAYLSHSKYGIEGEVSINSYNNYRTGCGPQSEGSAASGSTCNAYNTSLGQNASTTGNIYGIYDMSGGANEYVMGNIVSPDGITMMSGNRANSSYPNEHSGYDGILYYNGESAGGYGTYDGVYSYPENKYIDRYSFNTSYSTRSRSKLGDGIREVFNTSYYGWYSDYSLLAFSSHPWFSRGGSYRSGSDAGVFNSYYNYRGDAGTNYSSRLVISQ